METVKKLKMLRPNTTQLRLIWIYEHISLLILSLAITLSSPQAHADPAYTISGGRDFTSGSFAFGRDFIANKDFIIDALGYYDDGANGFLDIMHPVGLYTSNGSLLASVNVTTSNPLTASFRYQKITPIYIQKGLVYRIVGVSGRDNYSVQPPNFTADPAISDISDNYLYTTILSYNSLASTNYFWPPGFFGPNFNIQSTTLLGEYHLDESNWSTTAGDVKDTSGNNLHGTASGTPLPTASNSSPSRTGSSGTCGYADIASGSGQITFSGLAVTTTTSYYTSVSFWIYWNGADSSIPLGWQSYALIFKGGNFGFTTGGSDLYGTASTGLSNSWHHVAAVFVNGRVASNQLYVDGVKQTLSQKTGTPNNSLAVVQSTLYLSGWGKNTNNRFIGRLDEAKVYNGLLSDVDVTNLYNETHPCPVYSPSPPLAEYRMDESIWAGTTNEVADSSGNNYHGKAVSSLTTDSSGKLCRAGLFNGSSQYVSIPDAASLRLTGNFTLAAWIKTTSSASNDIIAKVAPNSPYGGYEFNLGFNTAGKPSLQAGGWNNSSGTATVNDGNWHHVAVQVNGSNIQFFVDGAVYGSAMTFAGATSTYTGNLVLGTAVDGSGGRFFNGLMDEVKIWNTALNSGQIALVYTNEAAGKNYDGTTRTCPSLLGQYHFEDGLWNGTSGEVADSSGTNHPGIAYGSPLPSPKTTNPARASVTGTCGYAETTGPLVGGGGFSFSNLGVSTANNAQTSVAFWMYWNGQDGAVPIGWQTYDLAFISGAFGFNTLNSDVYGISSAALANGWHHVVAVFTNGAVTSNKLYLDGVQQTLTQRVSTPYAPRAVVQSTLYVSGLGGSTNYRFTGRLDEVNVFNYALTDAEVSNLYNQTHACPANTGAAAANFNCVESGTSASSGRLYTKLSTAALSFDVVALRADGTTVETDFATSYGQSINKAVTLELVDGAGTPACSLRALLSPPVSQSITFTQADAGRKNVSLAALGKAYKDLRCRVTDSTQTPNKIGCSTDDFVVRPNTFTLTGTATADLTGTSTSAIPVFKTSSNFILTAASSVAGYDGTPKIDANQIQAHSGAAQAGTLAGSFTPASPLTGLAVGSNFNYAEVGYFRFAAFGVYDDNFASVDANPGDCTNDFSNSAVNGKIGCKFGNTIASSYFGRFIPDHLTASLGSHGGFAHACTGTTFSYNGQSIAYATGNRPTLSVSAYSTSNNTLLTRNYTGGFARLTPGQFSLTTPTTDAIRLGKDNLNKVLLTRVAAPPTLVDNTGGNLSYVLGADTYTYQREVNAMINKFTNQVNLSFTAITDSDGVSATNLPFTLSPSGEEIRYGRISLANALGSELQDLPVPMLAEYYNGTNFMLNTEDKCSVASINITDPINTDAISPANTCVWDTAGNSGSFACTTPAASGKNYLEASTLSNGSFNVVLKAPNVVGPLSISATVDAWMKFNWSGTGNSNPSSRASFGLYRGNSKIIHFQEVY